MFVGWVSRRRGGASLRDFPNPLLAALPGLLFNYGPVVVEGDEGDGRGDEDGAAAAGDQPEELYGVGGSGTSHPSPGRVWVVYRRQKTTPENHGKSCGQWITRGPVFLC